MAKSKDLPPLELLREMFEYRDGALRHRRDRRNRRLNVKAGDVVAGAARPDRYVQVRVQGRLYLLHRLIYQVVYGDLTAELEIDHINRDRLDNRIENLRVVTTAQNGRNQTRHARNTTGVTGVKLQRVSRIKVDGSMAEYRYYTAHWRDLSGKRVDKSFPIAKYGEDEAFRLACEYRKIMIAELNRQGAGYTPHHGLSSHAGA